MSVTVRMHNKLFLASLAVSAGLVAAMFFLMEWSIDRGMLDYVNVKERARWEPAADYLGRYYDENGSWSALAGSPRYFHDLVASYGNPNSRNDRNARRRDGPPPGDLRRPGGRPGERPEARPGQRPGERPGDRPNSRKRNGPGPDGGRNKPPMAPLVLEDPQGTIIAGFRDPDARYGRIPINSGDAVVGQLAYALRDQVTEAYDLNFLEQQREAFGLISLLVLLAAVLSSLPVARQLGRPLLQLAAATRRLANGDYGEQLAFKRKDELGELARDFNHLSTTLANNDGDRKRWLADTSHELRTPLAIMRAELEAMLDGVRPMTLETLRSAHQEVLHLGRLVDDLYELSNADIGAMRYRMAELDIAELVEDACDLHRPLLRKQQLQLSVDRGAHPILLWGDDTRLTQLLNNLLSNAGRYTHAGGQVRVSIRTVDDTAVLSVEDTAPGVPDDALPRLFDHLYRVDASRSRDGGGSGLGLALSRRIVEAHRGSITAAHSELGGLRVTATLPLQRA